MWPDPYPDPTDSRYVRRQPETDPIFSRKFIIVGIIAMVLLFVAGIFAMGAANQYNDDQFEKACVAAHPDAHMEIIAGRTRTHFCIGPNGQLWEVG